MKTKEDRSIGIKILNSLFATMLLVAVGYILLVGIEVVAMGAIVLALIGMAVPVAMSGEGVLAIVAGVFEALVEGVLVIFEAIANAISGLFG